jgi:hypothetical protein
MILLFLTVATLQPSDARQAIAQMGAARRAYRACIVEQTVALGKGNAEPAETVLRGVAAACRPAEDAMMEAYAATPFSRREVAIGVRRDRLLAEDEGVAALLAARAAK